MRQFQERQKIRNKVYSKPMLIGLVVLSLLFSKAVVNIYMKYKGSVEAERIALAKLASMKDRETSLRSDIENLESPEGLEEELRKKFNVANPGERMIVVVDDDKKEEKVEDRGLFSAMLFRIKAWFN